MESRQLRYNWADPDAYEAFIGRWSEHLAIPFLDRANVLPGGRVLDVACGTGVLTKALADSGMHVIGVDASEGYLEGARRRRSHPNIAYEHGDVRHMRFDNNVFDATVSTLALDVIPEIEQVVVEMKRVTRPGGVVASAVTQFYGGMPAFVSGEMRNSTSSITPVLCSRPKWLRLDPCGRGAKFSGQTVKRPCGGNSV